MNKLFLKVSILIPILVAGVLAVAQPKQTTPTTGLGQPSPAFKEDLWYSNQKIVLGHGAPAGAIIDGVFNDKVWTTKAGYDAAINKFPAAIDQSTMWGLFPNADQSIAGLPGASSYSGTNSSFGVAWDETYLYVAIAVNSTEFLAAKANVRDVLIGGTEIYIGADNTARSFSKTGGVFVWGGVAFPRAYGPSDYQFGMGPVAGKLNRRVNGEDLNFAVFQGPFSDVSVNGFVKETPTGYNVEMAIEWSKINSPFINPATGVYDQPDKFPSAGRVLGFDVASNVPKADGTDKVAKLMWNQCCTNRGWSESIHFGVLSLTGAAGAVPLSDISIAPDPLNINDKLPRTLEVSVTPGEATGGASYVVINPDPAQPIVFVSENGVVSPVNNGTATIVGTSLSKPPFAASGFVKSVTSVIVNVTNQPTILALNVANGEINTAWGSTVLSVSGTPSDAFAGVTWSFAEPSTLAFIGSVSGILRASGLGNGTVQVMAASRANPSITATGVVTIAKQTVITGGLLNVRNYQFVACGGRGLNAMTFAGYATDTKIDFFAEFYDPFTCTFVSVPPALMNYTLTNRVGSQVSKTVAELTTTVGQTGITIKSLSRQDLRVRATYINDPSFTVVVTIVGNLALVVDGGNCAAAGIPNPDGFTPTSACQSTTGVSATIDEAPVTLYPNPTSGDFAIDIDLLKGTVVTVTVSNTVGSVVSATKSSLASGKSTIPVDGSGLAKGLYFVTVSTSDGQSATKKLIVE